MKPQSETGEAEIMVNQQITASNQHEKAIADIKIGNTGAENGQFTAESNPRMQSSAWESHDASWENARWNCQNARWAQDARVQC